MAVVHKCRIKLDVTATRWTQHGDHPNVQQVPSDANVNVNGVTDKNLLGMIMNEQNQGTIFIGPVWIMDIGGRTFPVDDQYFNDYYEILSEPDVDVQSIPE